MRIIIAIVVLVFSQELCARPIVYNVANLIGSAKFVGIVNIAGFDAMGETVSFHSMEYEDTLEHANYSSPYNSGPPLNYEDHWTQKLPAIGDTVLIVVAGNGSVLFFGKQVGDYYRLWVPQFAWSTPIFAFEAPLLPINEEKQLFKGDGTTTSCWDGCLLPMAQLHTLVKRYRTAFHERLANAATQQYKNKEVYSIFYDQTLSNYSSLSWSDAQAGKLPHLFFTYSNGKVLEIVAANDGNDHLQIDLEKFKLLKIETIRWLE